MVIRNKSVSLLWELNSNFSGKFFEKIVYRTDHQHGHLVTRAAAIQEYVYILSL